MNDLIASMERDRELLFDIIGNCKNPKLKKILQEAESRLTAAIISLGVAEAILPDKSAQSGS